MLTTSEKHPVSFYVEAPGVGFYKSGTVVPNNETIVHISRSLIVDSYIDKSHGIYVKTDSDRVTVIGSSGLTRLGRVTTNRMETYVTIPVTDLCITEYEYFALSVNSSSSYRNSVVLVVGTEDDTVMKLTITQPVTISVDNTTNNLIVGREYSFVINRLQTVYMESNDDLTGTRIVTNNPITLLSGHECANVPWNSYSCSFLIEQIPPTALWGKLYYVTPLADLWSGYAVKVLASRHCSIFIYCCDVWTATLNSGESLFKIIENNQSCAIHSTEKVLVVQFSPSPYISQYYYGGPMMVIVPSIGQYYNTFTFSLYQPEAHEENIWFHHVNIIVLAQYYQPDKILISGEVNKSLDTQEWVPVKVNNTIEAYATQVNIPEGVVEITHTNTNAMMTIIMYGSTMYEGYGSAIMLPHGKSIVYSLYVYIYFQVSW